MEDKEQVLNAIHAVDKRVVSLESKIDDSVNGRFKDVERRVGNLEGIVKWAAIAIVGAVFTGILNLVLK